MHLHSHAGIGGKGHCSSVHTVLLSG
jgi:hypothetical protein